MQESPDKEWRRLTEHYAGMYDAELLELARDYKNLTEMAQQVLRDEMKKRGLGEPLAPRPREASQRVSEPASPRANQQVGGPPSQQRPVDPRAEEDRVRFAVHYATLTDDDLLDLADEMESLTAGAQMALEQELERRGLGEVRAITEAEDEEERVALARADARMTAEGDGADEESETAGPPEYTWKVALGEYYTRAEALQRMEMLRRAGIESWFADPYAQSSTNGITVAADQLEEAQRIIAHPVPPDIVEQSQTTVPEFEMPRCPRCHAAEPVLIDTEPTNKWLCESCGFEWDDPVAADGRGVTGIGRIKNGKSRPATGQLFLRENSSNGGKAIRTFWLHSRFRSTGCQGEF